MNFVAVLAVLAATSFALPLLVQAGEAAGLGRGESVAASLLLALAAALLLLARTVWVARRARARNARAPRERRVASRRPRKAQPSGPPRSASGSLAEPQPQGLRANLRLIEAEEESRAGL